ncbi:MAG: hypothetical protein ACJ8F7_07420 [Gemmataceae bacterium]
MGFEFLHQHGGRRLWRYADQAAPPADDTDPTTSPEAPAVFRDFEIASGDWGAIPVSAATPAPGDWPRRFIDGCYQGETVAWLQDDDGHPLPVRLAEIGGVCLRLEGRTLGRETAAVERVVAAIVDPFPGAEIGEFAAALSAEGYRLVRVPPRNGTLSYDLRIHREDARVAVLHELPKLEQVALLHDRGVPSLVDGRLGRFPNCGFDGWDVVGVIKRQVEDYLHPHGHRVLLGLQPGERTPAFELASKHLPVVSWYLKLAGGDGAMPDWGVVRVEIPVSSFERHGRDWGYLDRLSNCLLKLRCRQHSYARGPVSLEPIVRAEESLKALLTPLLALTQHFYRVSQL